MEILGYLDSGYSEMDRRNQKWRWRNMAFMQVELFSQALHMAVGVDLILPQPVKNEIGMESGEKTDKKYPTLWLLHGATDDQTT